MADSRGFGYGKSKFLGSENLILRSPVFFHNEILKLVMPRFLPGSILSNYSSSELLQVFRTIMLREREIMKTSPCQWGYSSGVEHLTADQEVPGSNPGAPCIFFML